MKTYLCAMTFVCCTAIASLASAQHTPPAPEKEHEWLAQFTGEWDSESEANMGPGQPAMKCKGSLVSKKLGEFWVINNLTGDMMGTEMKGLQTIGYDAEKKKFVGTWVDNMTNYMWQYEGSLDESGKKLVLEAEGPNMLEPGKKAKFRDSYEFKDKDHMIATSEMQTADGKWLTFMTGQVTRRKK